MVNENIKLVTKDDKGIRLLCMFFPEMNIYKRYVDKTKWRCFMIKDEISFDKYMKVLEKLNNIIKRINSKLIYNKKYLNLKRVSTQKKAFMFLYTSNTDWFTL